VGPDQLGETFQLANATAHFAAAIPRSVSSKTKKPPLKVATAI
jgi:hypothetical protein